MPRKDDINKGYHSNNPRARGNSRANVDPNVLEEIPGTPWWSFDNLDNAWNGRMENEWDYWLQSFIMGVPGVNGVFQSNWNKNALQHYMDQYGLTWQDLLSRNVFGGQFSNVGALKNTTNFVSDMIKELYS